MNFSFSLSFFRSFAPFALFCFWKPFPYVSFTLKFAICLIMHFSLGSHFSRRFGQVRGTLYLEAVDGWGLLDGLICRLILFIYSAWTSVIQAVNKLKRASSCR